MWSMMKYLYLAIRLGTLWENLKAVRAKDPATTTEMYQPAAAAVLSDPSMVKFVATLPAEDGQKFVEQYPLFLRSLDFLTE